MSRGFVGFFFLFKSRLQGASNYRDIPPWAIRSYGKCILFFFFCLQSTLYRSNNHNHSYVVTTHGEKSHSWGNTFNNYYEEKKKCCIEHYRGYRGGSRLGNFDLLFQNRKVIYLKVKVFVQKCARKMQRRYELFSRSICLNGTGTLNL